MLKSILFIIITGCFFLTGCKDQSKKNLIPELATCDSIAVMYYHTPGNPRFFNMTKVYDKKILGTIAENINEKVIGSKDSCATQGKIYYYGKGDAVYSIYFSSLKDCMTMSFIKTGEKYFVSMSETTKNILDELQKVAKEPRSEINK
ncbi:MAG TPA: hypothetical protein VJU78_18535 [Chitinophagaceae bacterium]|nr:hypothetical protein [Chitinophagaceae bacterium]